MKELIRFRQFLAEGDFYKDKPKPSPEALIKVFQDEIRYAKENEEDDIVPAYEAGIEMLKQGGDPYEVNDKVQGMYIKITGDFSYDPTLFIDDARKIDAGGQINENRGEFGQDKKIALQNSLTGLAKDMVEDGTLFAEGGNVTYNEENLKDGATPEQIKAIDQIKSAVDKMGGEVTYGEKDSDGELSYTYLVFGGDLKVITKES